MAQPVLQKEDWSDVSPYLDFPVWGKVVSSITEFDAGRVTAGGLWPTIKDALTLDRLGKFVTSFSKYFKVLAKETGLTLSVVVEAFKSKNVFNVLKALGFALAKAVSAVRSFAALYESGIMSVFRGIVESGALDRIKRGLMRVDELLNRYPLLKRLAGVGVAGFLLWCFLTANFTSVPKLDMDMSTVVSAALHGDFSLDDLFTSPSGVLLLTTLFTSLAGFAMPTPVWLAAAPPLNVLVAFAYTGLRHLATKSPFREALVKLKTHITAWVTPARIKPMLAETSALQPETAAVRHAKDADIGLLGLNTQDAPSYARFPPCFNKAANTVWRDTIESDGYKAVYKKASGTGELWTVAVKLFLKRCDAVGVFPFSNAHDFEKTATAYLKAARRKLVAFVDKHGLFDHLRVSSVDRSYTFTDKNFRLVCKATLRRIDDPTMRVFMQRLPEPSFKMHSDGVYRKSVHAGIDLEFTMSPYGDASFTYTIFCHTPIHLIRPELPSKKRLTTYADRQLWIPILKAARFKGKGVGNKLF
jgi:hypothetical protein